MKNYLWLLLALVVDCVAIMLSRTLHLPESVAMSLTTGVAMLALFPFLKRWLPKVTFAQWVIVVVVGALSTGLIYFAFSKLGWG